MDACDLLVVVGAFRYLGGAVLVHNHLRYRSAPITDSILYPHSHFGLSEKGCRPWHVSLPLSLADLSPPPLCCGLASQLALL